jgi:hypothetical protein
MDKESIQEAAFTVEQVQQLFRDLTVGGLLTAGAEKINMLRTLGEEFSRIGAAHIAGHLKDLLQAVEDSSRESAVLLMRAQASIRLFDRLLTLEYAADQLAEITETNEEER